MSSVSGLSGSSVDSYSSLLSQSSISNSISSSTNLSINSLSSSVALGLTTPTDQILFSKSALEKLTGSSQDPNPSNSSSTGSDSTASDSSSTLQALLAKLYS